MRSKNKVDLCQLVDKILFDIRDLFAFSYDDMALSYNLSNILIIDKSQDLSKSSSFVQSDISFDIFYFYHCRVSGKLYQKIGYIFIHLPFDMLHIPQLSHSHLLLDSHLIKWDSCLFTDLSECGLLGIFITLNLPFGGNSLHFPTKSMPLDEKISGFSIWSNIIHNSSCTLNNVSHTCVCI